MAVTAITGADIPIRDDRRQRMAGFKWVGLKYDAGGALTVGSRFEWNPGVNRCIQVVGTLGTGGHLKFRGSNLPDPDPTVSTDWFLCTDPQGNAIDMSALGGVEITETPRWVSPIVTAGDSNTLLDVYLNTVRSGGMP